MSKRVGNSVIIEPEADCACELCGKVAECRPYGPNGAQICFECGVKDPATRRRMAHKLLGEGEN